jgi:hypothetical protein
MKPVTLLVALLLAVPARAGVDREDGVQIFNRDVYVLDGPTLRNPDGDTPASAALYNRLGVSLDTTWGEFRRAKASSRMRCSGGRTDVRIRLNGLIPDGVYSIFHGTFQPDSVNPLCPNVERTLALPSKDCHQEPDFASFVADDQGEADFHGRIEGCLLDATQVFMHVVYHFDGHTYGAVPNRGEFFTQGPDCRSTFGEDAMRHLVVLQKW